MRIPFYSIEFYQSLSPRERMIYLEGLSAITGIAGFGLTRTQAQMFLRVHKELRNLGEHDPAPEEEMSEESKEEFLQKLFAELETPHI